MTTGSELRRDVLGLFRSDMGRQLGLIKTATGDYDPDTGAATATTAPHRGRGKIGDYNDRLVDGTSILAGDRLCTWLPEQESIVPTIGDKIVDGSTHWSIIRVKTRELSGVVATYTLQLRRV